VGIRKIEIITFCAHLASPHLIRHIYTNFGTCQSAILFGPVPDILGYAIVSEVVAREVCAVYPQNQMTFGQTHMAALNYSEPVGGPTTSVLELERRRPTRTRKIKYRNVIRPRGQTVSPLIERDLREFRSCGSRFSVLNGRAVVCYVPAGERNNRFFYAYREF